MSFFKQAENQIYYEVKGEGPPLLLIAGMASDSTSWQFIQDYLLADFTMIIFDNRGCGRTTYAGPFQLLDIADDAAALLDHLDIDKVHLLGHSMGGMIAQEFALKYPNRLNKLILASSVPKISDNAANKLDELLNKWEDGLDRAAWFTTMFRHIFTPKALENKNFMKAAVVFALSYPYPQSLQGFADQVTAIKALDTSDRLAEIQNETLILSGEKDILFTPEESRSLLNISDATQFITIKDAAHSIHAEKPKAFCDELRTFILNAKNGEP